LVLSDGQPASNRGNCKDFTKNVIRQIENGKNTEIYAIGIETDCVKNLYTNSRVIQSPNELEGAVLSVVKNYILS